MSYFSDDHTHSRLSADARFSMADMARAGVRAGLQEMCFTDHVSPLEFHGYTPAAPCDWDAFRREIADARQALGGSIALHLGMELGDATLDLPGAERLVASEPEELDFIIGSNHRLSARFGREDLYNAASGDVSIAREQIADYLERTAELARWGKFDVLGHLTLPLRYMNELRGLHMTFDGFEDQVAAVFRELIANGRGIEVNTNRGHQPLPGEKWLRLYRSLGGEIVTLGSDAHTPEYVGCAMRETQDLLRGCGFSRFCTFQRRKPVWHAL